MCDLFDLLVGETTASGAPLLRKGWSGAPAVMMIWGSPRIDNHMSNQARGLTTPGPKPNPSLTGLGLLPRERADERTLESLILAQDERWRRA